MNLPPPTLSGASQAFVEVSYIFLQHTVALTVVVLSACVALYGDESVAQTALAFVSDDPRLLPQHSSVIVYCLFGCIPRLFLRSCYILPPSAHPLGWHFLRIRAACRDCSKSVFNTFNMLLVCSIYGSGSLAPTAHPGRRGSTSEVQCTPCHNPQPLVCRCL